MGTKGFTQYKRRGQIKKMLDLSEEGEPKLQEIKCGNEIRQSIWNDLHCQEGKTNKWQPV